MKRKLEEGDNPETQRPTSYLRALSFDRRKERALVTKSVFLSQDTGDADVTIVEENSKKGELLAPIDSNFTRKKVHFSSCIYSHLVLSSLVFSTHISFHSFYAVELRASLNGTPPPPRSSSSSFWPTL